MNITIGIPIIDTLPGEAFYNHALLIAMIARDAKICIPPCLNLIPHDRARSFLFDCAVKSESQYLLFIDDDMIIPPDAFCSLLEVFHTKRPRPVAVSGHYYRRGYPYTCVWSKLDGGQYQGLDAQRGVHEIHYSGLGCCLIDVQWVRENLTPPYFTMEIKDGCTQITDDVSFFERIRLAGGSVYGHGGIRCGHLDKRHVICDLTVDKLRQEHILIDNQVAEASKSVRSVT